MTTLYWYWTTNPQKVRLALEEWIIPHNLVKVHLGKGEHRRAEYQTIHPKKSVPTLVFNDQTYWESNAALLALANAQPELLPPVDTPEYAQSLNLLFMEACTFQRWAGVHFMEQIIYPLIGRPTSPENIQHAHTRLESSFDILERQIGSKNHLFADFCIVDCAFAPWLPHLDLSAHPNMNRWFSNLRQRDSWKQCGFRQ